MGFGLHVGAAPSQLWRERLRNLLEVLSVSRRGLSNKRDRRVVLIGLGHMRMGESAVVRVRYKGVGTSRKRTGDEPRHN